ncbi:MAG: Crp/Fnr family transcriptional regulator [Pirellulaceae bacterium]
MSKQVDVGTLRKIEFLRDVADDDLEALARIAKTLDYPARAVIFQENEYAKDVFLVVKGHVSLVICEPDVGCRQITEVHDGELLGWSPLVERVLLSATAHTVLPTTILAFDGDQLLTLCAERPKLGFQFMHRTAQVLAQRLNATRMELFKKCGWDLPKVVMETD